MKAALRRAAAVAATAPTWGAWTALGEDDANSVWYVDRTSIRTESNVRQVRALKEVAQPLIDSIGSMQLLCEADCPGRRHRLVQYQNYQGRMGTSDLTRGGMVFGKWMTAGPGTVGGGLTKAVCSRDSMAVAGWHGPTGDGQDHEGRHSSARHPCRSPKKKDNSPVRIVHS
jgi:hypothetical protein